MTRPPRIDSDGVEAFVTWKQPFVGSELRLWDYVSAQSSVGLAAALSTVFWPEFIEIDGCVLLAEYAANTNHSDWMRSLQQDRSRVEAAVNHVHLYDLFYDGSHAEGLDEDRTLETLNHVARVLQRTWTYALREAFPERTFVVSFTTDPEEYGPTITFWQVRDSQPVSS